MIDIGISKIALIGAVALIVIGPDKLPRVARTIGALLGKAQRYVGDLGNHLWPFGFIIHLAHLDLPFLEVLALVDYDRLLLGGFGHRFLNRLFYGLGLFLLG